jgi:ACT domain-containing protein
LQTFYKYKSIINQPTESYVSHRRVVISCVWFCKSLQTFTNTKASSINQPIAAHRIAVFSSHACGFCNSLQTFYKYKSLITQPTESNATQRNATQRNATQRNATQRNATHRIASHRSVVISCVC